MIGLFWLDTGNSAPRHLQGRRVELYSDSFCSSRIGASRRSAGNANLIHPQSVILIEAVRLLPYVPTPKFSAQPTTQRAIPDKPERIKDDDGLQRWMKALGHGHKKRTMIFGEHRISPSISPMRGQYTTNSSNKVKLDFERVNMTNFAQIQVQLGFGLVGSSPTDCV